MLTRKGAELFSGPVCEKKYDVCHTVDEESSPRSRRQRDQADGRRSSFSASAAKVRFGVAADIDDIAAWGGDDVCVFELGSAGDGDGERAVDSDVV